MSEPVDERLRIDKWLWHARFFKSRSIAAEQCKSGKVRMNGDSVSKSSATVRPGDTLTFPKEKHIRVVKVVALGTRRGPAIEAQALYEDLAPPPSPEDLRAQKPQEALPQGRDVGSGRPTKKERRAIDQLHGQ